jgi:predicted nucleic acid-binding protein
MTVFVDTSAILALLVPTDIAHVRAAKAFASLQDEQAPLVTTSYVLVETYALIGRRLGLRAVDAIRRDFEPLLEVVWIDRKLHDAGLELLLARGTTDLSLVDASSWVVINERGIGRVFAFDRHYDVEGFSLVAP